jgi:hypothetical protein
MTLGTLKVRVVASILSSLFKGRHLRNQAKITLNIAKTGYIRRVFIFSFRPPAGLRAPAVR